MAHDFKLDSSSFERNSREGSYHGVMVKTKINIYIFSRLQYIQDENKDCLLSNNKQDINQDDANGTVCIDFLFYICQGTSSATKKIQSS